LLLLDLECLLGLGKFDSESISGNHGGESLEMNIRARKTEISSSWFHPIQKFQALLLQQKSSQDKGSDANPARNQGMLIRVFDKGESDFI
jgi:hypothetical protein